MSIPKVIHYCWFGRGPRSELMVRCMESWKNYCPDYEIIEWNEDNFDVDFCAYAAKAYRQKRYGFLPDAARLKIIYDNGGIYLDTDVELKRSLDELLELPAWFGYGTDTGINPGSGFGGEKGNPFIKKLLDQYLAYDDSVKFEVCTNTDTRTFARELPGFAANKTIRQEYPDVVVLNDIWRYTDHHYTSTWMSPWQRFETKVANLMPGKMRETAIHLRRKAIDLIRGR